MRIATIAAATAVAVLGVATSGVRATFECEQVWNAPAANNSLAACVVNPNHLYSMLKEPARLQYAGAIIIAIITLVWWLLMFPIVTTCRYVCKCFGSYRRRPGAFCGGSEWDDQPEHVKQDAYDPRLTRIVFWLPIGVAASCFAGMGLLLAGSTQIETGYSGTFSDVNGLGTWLNGKLSDINTTMRINGALISPLQESYFTNGANIIQEYHNQVNSAQTTYQPYIDMGRTIAICIGVVPLVIFAFNVVFALLHVRRIFPLLNSCVLFLLVLLFGVVAMILCSLGLILNDVCDEVSVYENGRKPGIFSWYVIPLCEQDLPFNGFKNQIDQAEMTQAQNGCNYLLNVCSATQTLYNTATPNKMWECPGLTNATSQCTTFQNVSYYINNSVLMNGVSTAGYGCTGSGTCTFRSCAQGCNPSSAQTYASDAVTAMDEANRAFNAWTNDVEPILDCNVMLTEALTALGHCSNVQLAVWYIGCGSLLYEVLSGVSLVAIWLGQKRWFDPSAADATRKTTNEPYSSTRRNKLDG